MKALETQNSKLKTPRELGYQMPAEWAPHEATWIAWPHNEDDWPRRFGPIPGVFVDIIRHLHRNERVRILFNSEHDQRTAADLLSCAGVDPLLVDSFLIPTDRVWTRDFAPIFIKNTQNPAVAATNWSFNAWAKYDNWQRDDAVSDRLVAEMNWRQWRPVWRDRRVVLEGGSIDVNGLGALLTTEECLLSDVQARNPGFTKEDWDDLFAEYLGVCKVIWLNRGIVGDDTHGHVDDLARFVDERTVVAAIEDNPSDANYEPLQENQHRLREATDQSGRPLRIVPLPMPEPIFIDGQRLPASYANFYIANGVVLVPIFEDENDSRALEILAGVFSSREVIGVPSRDLVWGLGTIHCMTQQQPL